jgi:hypothetical protein
VAVATGTPVQQAPRARGLQRVDDTMVGFQVDDVVGNADVIFQKVLSLVF